MVKFCPHDLFVNTRADLGACSKVHDEEIRKLFEQAKGHRKIHYQEEFIRFCTSMINEVERKIQKGKQRLALSSKGEAPALTPVQTQRNQEQISLLNERINGLVEEAEQAGTDGNVEQAQGINKRMRKRHQIERFIANWTISNYNLRLFWKIVKRELGYFCKY